jgi:arginine exporter protein ArgO
MLSSAFLLICHFNVVLLLGEHFGATRDYPYSEAVSTVTAGKLSARMEGFAYLMYYAIAAVKTAVSIAFACCVIREMLPKKQRKGCMCVLNL